MKNINYNICLENFSSVSAERFLLEPGLSQGFSICPNLKGATMKPSKKNAAKKAVIKSPKDIKSKSQTCKMDQTLDEIELQKAQDFIEEYCLEERIERNFDEEEKKYRDEISELFSLYPELTPDANMFLLANHEEDMETLQPAEIPFFQVFMFDQLKCFGKERVLEEGYYEIDELIERAISSTNDYCSLGEEKLLSKIDKMFAKNTQDIYKRTIINYARSSFRFKKLLVNMNIATSEGLI